MTTDSVQLLSYGLRIKDSMARHEKADVIIIQQIDFMSHARILHLYGDVSITGKACKI
jgi:hypothetical protein